MKKFAFLLVAVISLTALSASAQDFSDPRFARYGDTPEERKENAVLYNFFGDAFKNKDYNLAAGYLQQLLERRPQLSVNLYVNGASIYKNKIARATSPEQRNMFIDSLFLLYDKRMEYFGDDAKLGRPYILSLMAREYQTFKPGDREGIRKHFREAIEANGEGVDRQLVVAYFNELADDYQATEVEADEVFAEYDRLLPLFEAEQYAEEKKQFESILANSGAAGCDKLEELFGPQIEADPANVDLLSRVWNLLTRAKCTDLPFYLHVTEAYYAVNPTSQAALFLAQQFQNANDLEKALKYVNEALQHETDPKELANLYVRIAGIELANNRITAAAEAARKAREADPTNGWASFLLGQAYAASASGCSGMDRSAVYWAAYDMLSQARQLVSESDDPEKEEQLKLIQNAMNSYRAGFPTAEDGFFYELREGAPYTVGCGLPAGQRTTVRFQ